MTYAPPDLLAVQRYVQAKTGQSWAALGIIHATPQGGGYHEGEDLLIRAGTAPGPQYPGSDYSYTDSARDLLANGRLAGGDAASAFDFGGGFSRFLEFNAWMRQRMLANDPRTRDIREMIYTLDKRTVRRIDRTGKQADSGDSSHLSHTHFSFYRDSVGRRDRDDNFLGLLREFFDGKAAPAPATGGATMPNTRTTNWGFQGLDKYSDSDLVAMILVNFDPEAAAGRTPVHGLSMTIAWIASLVSGVQKSVEALAVGQTKMMDVLSKGSGNPDTAAIIQAYQDGLAEVRAMESDTVQKLLASNHDLTVKLRKALTSGAEELTDGPAT